MKICWTKIQTLHDFYLYQVSIIVFGLVSNLKFLFQTENIPVVRRPDRKDLLGYLNGEACESILNCPCSFFFFF